MLSRTHHRGAGIRRVDGHDVALVRVVIIGLGRGLLVANHVIAVLGIKIASHPSHESAGGCADPGAGGRRAGGRADDGAEGGAGGRASQGAGAGGTARVIVAAFSLAAGQGNHKN